MARRKSPTEIADINGMTKAKPSRYIDRGDSRNCELAIEVNKGTYNNKETSDAWDCIVPALQRLQILTVQDLAKLNVMFNALDVYYDAFNKLDKFIKDTKDNFYADEKNIDKYRKLVMTKSAAWADFNKASSYFGLSPVERTNLIIPEKKKVEDPLDIVLGGF